MFKVILFALLVANTAWFAVGGSRSKALDALAWLLLLALFEAETRFALYLRTRHRRAGLRTLRLAAAAGVAAATIGYVFEDDLLDAVNSAVWIAVVVLLEVELRYRNRVRRARFVFTGVAAGLYAALALLVVIWACRKEWFDAYDALLWLAAFAAIELDVMSDKRSADAAVTLR